MSTPKLPGEDRKGPSWQRIAVWIVVGAIGLYMVGSGLIAILTKG